MSQTMHLVVPEMAISNTWENLKEFVRLASENLTGIDGKFAEVEAILKSRVAEAIVYWCERQADKPKSVDQPIKKFVSGGPKDQYSFLTYYKNVMQTVVDTLRGLVDGIPDKYEPTAEILEKAFRVLDKTHKQHGQASIVQAQVRSPEAYRTLPLSQQQVKAWLYENAGPDSSYFAKLARFASDPVRLQQELEQGRGRFLMKLQAEANLQSISGDYQFKNTQITINQLWEEYRTTIMTTISTEVKVDIFTHNRFSVRARLRSILSMNGLYWATGLIVAFLFDILTTWVLMDQTPLEEWLVILFTVLFSIVFLVADQLVVKFARLESESKGLVAKAQATVDQLQAVLDSIPKLSESFIPHSERLAQWEAYLDTAQRSLNLARRGKGAFIIVADVNIVVTAWGLSFLLFNSQDPFVLLQSQIEQLSTIGLTGQILIFPLIITLAIATSIGVNTMQRSQIQQLGLSQVKNHNEGS